MISKILVAVDGSKNADKAFEYACDLAEKAGASLFICHFYFLILFVATNTLL